VAIEGRRGVSVVRRAAARPRLVQPVQGLPA
jgi:hypothetical protein